MKRAIVRYLPISYLYREILLKVNEILDKYYSSDSEIVAISQFKKDIETINLFNVKTFDEDKCKELYNIIRDNSWIEREGLLDEAIENTRRSGNPIDNKIDENMYYCYREVAAPITGSKDYYLAWTYAFGGGKYGKPWEVEWMDNCYLVREKEEIKVVKVYLPIVDDNEKVEE